MSHPNPYLFQINRLDGKLVAEWMIQQVLFVPTAGCYGYARTQLLYFRKVELYYNVRKHFVV
jgi:hypothetical protein